MKTSITADLGERTEWVEGASADEQEIRAIKNLMVAVLENAITCLVHFKGAESGRFHTYFKETEEWLLEDDDSEVFSFLNICNCLKINPSALRHKLISEHYSVNISIRSPVTHQNALSRSLPHTDVE